VSFGLVDASTAEDLGVSLARADAALLEAKRAGRDRVVRHVDAMHHPDRAHV
jgi:PleD family two-component response regulator